MPGDYHILASIYDVIGMADFSSRLTPRLIDFAQRHGWIGRQIIDLGCGSGQSLTWLAQHGYIVRGVDRSPQMLTITQRTLSDANAQADTEEQDIRQLSGIGEMEMALALDVMHEMGNLRELEAAFSAIHGCLAPGKWLIFDMFTIEGLITRYQQGDFFEHDSDSLSIFIRNEYDFERQIQHRTYLIFNKVDDAWQRYTARRVLRGYPVQAITALVQRSGFDVVHTLDLTLAAYDPNTSTPRVIIMAQKR